MEVWQGLDGYLLNADRALCSAECPCYITNTIPFQYNETVQPIYSQWVTTPQDLGAVNFQGCPTAVKRTVYNQAVQSSELFDPEPKQFNEQKFWDYMSRFEDQFSCTGFCFNTYIDKNSGKESKMFKYLFTDINKGVPIHSGCLNSILQWLPSYLLAYGSVGMVLAGVEIALLFIALSLLKATGNKEEQVEILDVREVRPANKQIPVRI
jgi:hypothetical protein